jgi:hypothetical protein
MTTAIAHILSRRAGGALVVAWAVVATRAEAAELTAATVRAYDSYVEQARSAFVAGAREPDMTAPHGRTLRITGGLIHHWRGAIFIPGVGLDHVLATAQAYENYATIYQAVLVSRLVDRDGSRYRVFARVKEDAGIVSAVLDVWSAVTYLRREDCAYSLSEAEDIREVEHPEQADERYLPPGRDSGYLWRANTFTRFVTKDGGVLVELETIGLSRSFSRLLAWLIEPVARRVGRSSVERTLGEFRSAVLAQGNEAALDVLEERIEAYAALRRRVEEPLPPLQPTTDMDAVDARRARLAEAIKAARSEARQADIFTFSVATHLRRVIRDALKGVDVEAMLLDLYEEQDLPRSFRPHVHDAYPRWATQAMPAILLLRLPSLPPDIEYRLIGRDLVLLDLRAGLIIDVLRGAIPLIDPSRSLIANAMRPPASSA